MALTPQRRNVLVLALCQAITMTSITIMVPVSSLVGQELADDRAFATWPLGLQQIGVMLATFPASLLMRRISRRAGFTTGAVIGVGGALIQVYAVFHFGFWLFCLGNGLVGVANGFSLFYRFAATDMADVAFKSKAISLVMAGGVVAALLGQQLAKWSHDWFAPVFFAGSFLAIAALQGLGGLMVQFVRVPRPTEQERSNSGRPLMDIVRQPVFLVAVSGSMIGYGVMSLVMTATPLAMVECGYSFSDSAFVIQWHVLGMFVPSFFTGHLIARYGVLKIMLAGALIFAGCVGVNLSGIAIWQFWSALILLGLGWNFLYIGGSTLLTEAYLPEERAKTQAVTISWCSAWSPSLLSPQEHCITPTAGKRSIWGSLGRPPWFAGPWPGSCCVAARQSPESVKGADQPVAPAGRFSYVPAAFRGPRRRRRGRFPRDGWMT